MNKTQSLYPIINQNKPNNLQHPQVPNCCNCLKFCIQGYLFGSVWRDMINFLIFCDEQIEEEKRAKEAINDVIDEYLELIT